ncbi:MAG: tetratricopeptide repeat protein [Alphaproteobacteria bacterium]|nr:tetratricopeptide repeat protein [Alphaproteobacteria bacterium]MDE1987182.1 tetratricopeptide repeat protein [Alphaproteobacteria bacterium]MDE2163629.1 tetratricopeptide repeat protein [Alphaproteobacteria bacterium]MDE2500869.1 tetratricopeptide repeat protein [Alphaproteobacteria bacterium]
MRHALSRLFVAVLLSGGVFFLLMPAAAPMAQAAEDQATTLELSGLDAMQSGDTAGAVEKLRQALALKPKDKAFRENLAQALNNQGVAQYGNQDYAGAVTSLQDAVSLVPNFTKAKENLAMAQVAQFNIDGNALYKAGKFSDAADKFRQALAADPKNSSARVNLDLAETELLTKSGDYAGAVAKLQDALALTPDSQMIKDRLATEQAALDAQQKAAAEKAKEKKSD